jgi:5-methylcytosine-specific restriction endonuclease McrA
MSTVREAVAAMERLKKLRPRRDLAIKRFYSSRAWRVARYRYLKSQPRPLRCTCCGATAMHARLVVDHIVAIKKDWELRLDQTNFQMMCDDCNLAKGSIDATRWQEASEDAR